MMNKSSLAFTGSIIVTLLMLAYVHGQTSIYRVSYAIHAKEKQLSQLNERYQLATNSLAKLTSPTSLSRRAKEASLDLIIPRHHEVVKVLKTPVVHLKDERMNLPRASFMSLLHFVKVAQAKTLSNE